MKIRKLQQGGIPLPTIAYTPLGGAEQVPTAQAGAADAASAKSSSSSPQKELFKNLIDQLKARGLPNDVESLFSSFTSVFPSIFGMSDLSSGSVGTNDMNTDALINSYMAVLPQINRVEFNKQAWDSSLDRVTKNDALDEYAVTSNGLMVVMDEDGEIQQIRQSEFKKNPSQYAPLTNVDLANLRANNPNMAWDTNVFSILNTGIGTNKITEQILEIATKIGKEKETRESIGGKQSQILQGINVLINEGPENVFYKHSSITETQKKNAEQALAYIYRTLPNNSRAVLKTRAAITGLDPDKGAHELIATLVSGVTDHSVSNTVDMVKDPNYNYETGSKNNEKLDDFTLLEQVQAREGISTYYNLSPGTGFGWKSLSQRFNQLQDSVTGKGIGRTNLYDALNQSGLQNLVDISSIYIGDVKVDPYKLDKVLYNGNEIANAYLPYKYDDNGQVSPDFSVIQKYSDAVQEIENRFPQGNAPITAVTETFSKYGLGDALYPDATGNLQWNPNRFMGFLMVNVTASNAEDVLEDDQLDSSMLLNPIKSDGLKKDLASIISTKDRQYKVDDLYQGVAFMPMNASMLQAQTGAQNFAQVRRFGDRTYNQQAAYEANRTKRSTYRSSNSSLLQ